MRFLLFGVLILAQIANAETQKNEFSEEWQKGKRHVTVVCSACHGLEGMSLNSLYPNLRGQKKDYLVSQLKAFRNGSRTHALMESFAKPLTDDQIQNLALYYSSFPRFEVQNRPMSQLVESCVGCHGPMGKSAAEMFPNLSGQRYDYLVNQMRNLKSGKRVNQFMNPLMANVTDEDILNIAKFFTGDRIN